MFQELPSSNRLEHELTTKDSLLRKEFKEICEECGEVVYEGPNVGEAQSRFIQHCREEHGITG